MGAGEIPCKPYKVLHNQNQERVTNRRSEKEAKDLGPGAVAVTEDCWEQYSRAARHGALCESGPNALESPPLYRGQEERGSSP